MDVGIVGLAGSGRTTVFRALLAHRAPREAGGRHGGTSVGAIHVQDPRLDRLSTRFRPQKTTPVEIRVQDLCTSLEPSFPRAEIEAMKRMDLLLLVIPAFLEDTESAIVTAFDRLLAELCLEDLAAVESRLKRAAREKLPESEQEALQIARDWLEKERLVGSAPLSEAQRQSLRGYALLTDRAQVAVLNTAEAAAGSAPPEKLQQRALDHEMPLVTLCAGLEAEMAELAAEERSAFLAEYGIREPAGARLTRAILERADLISFFTVGEDECRAWPIRRGTRALEAAGKIHSDIERGFIRAEVVASEDLETLPGGLTEARKLGKLRLEGKDYTIRDGEVVHFRFNI